MVKATMPSILNTIRNIFMRLYGSVEEVMCVLCIKYENMAALVFISLFHSLPPSPPPPAKKNFFFPGFGFFVKIHLLESSKLDL